MNESINPGDLVAIRDSENDKWNLFGDVIYIAEDKVHNVHVIYDLEELNYDFTHYVKKKSEGEKENKKMELLRLIDEAGLTKEDLFGQ